MDRSQHRGAGGLQWGSGAAAKPLAQPRVQHPRGKTASQGAHLHGDIPTPQPSWPGSLSLGHAGLSWDPARQGNAEGTRRSCRRWELQALGAVLPRLARSPGKAAAEY